MKPLTYRIKIVSDNSGFHKNQYYVEYQTRFLHRWKTWRECGMDSIEGYPFYYSTIQEAEYDFLKRGLGINNDEIAYERKLTL